MDSVLNAVNIVLAIFTIIAIGMFLVAIGWLKDEHSALISRLVVKVALPCTIINNIFTKFTRESILTSVVGIIIPYLSMIVTFFIALFIARLFRISKGRKGVFVCMFTFSNSVFIGLPVSTALFGDSATPYALLYYIANTSLFWTIGHSLMSKDGGIKENTDFGMIIPYLKASKEARKDQSFAPARAALKKISSILPIPLIFFLVSVILLLLGVKLPKFLTSGASYVGSMVTPLSLFYTGMVIMRMIKAKRIRWQKGYEWILLGRFAFGPMLLIGSVLLMNAISGLTGIALFKADTLLRDVLIIQAAMPVMAQTPIVAASCGSDEEYAAGGIALTTALSLVFIPLYMYIITAWL